MRKIGRDTVDVCYGTKNTPMGMTGKMNNQKMNFPINIDKGLRFTK